MRFSKIIQTFKNGLASPLLRGRSDIQGLESSAEEFQNNYADSTGSTRRRPGTTHAGNFEQNSGNDTTQSFLFTLLGQDYFYTFNQSYTFNEVDAVTGISKFFRVANTDGHVFGASAVGTSTIGDMTAWNQSLGPVSSALGTYLAKTLEIKQWTQISDRTVVFTTNYFPFAVTLMDYEATVPVLGKVRTKKFVMYPYFVNLSVLNSNQYLASGARKCPIRPTNYPFNVTNSDSTKLVFASVVAGQSGGAASSGVLTNESNAYVHHVDIPYSVHNYPFTPLNGAFIRVQTVDSKEAVFFLTEDTSDASSGGLLYRRYTAIQVVGGTINAAGTSIFTLSSWNDALGYPKCTTTYKSRLMFANSGADLANTVWAAAINSSSPFDYQGMMADVLIQDQGASDVSGMLYYNQTNTTRRGFSLAFSDGEGEEIRWMMARRRLHLGTSKGEYQITVNETFSRDTADQSKIGTISSDYIQPVGGDRKIIYAANGGKEVRFISVEDRDYESVDGKINALLAGMDITVKRLAWLEKMRVLLVLTTSDEVYACSLDSILQINAFSKWTFPFTVKDLCTSGTSAYFIFNAPFAYDDNAVSNVKSYAFLNVNDLDTGVNVHYDLLRTLEVLSLPVNANALAGQGSLVAWTVGNCNVDFYANNKLWRGTYTSASAYPDPGFAVSSELVDTLEVGDFVVIGVPYKSRLKSMPIEEGSQFGSAVGDVKRIDRITVQTYNSGNFYYGSKDETLYKTENLLDGNITTRNVKVEFPQSYDHEVCVIIETDAPTPLNISGIALRGVSYPGE